ncbi:RWP-RK domain-containing protein [Legionella maioricensis]|uniref:RWP-RK domain-containing protein n=1 Tax=Legionella maioricensis TaxID=2896528 RepID=A0A9X2D225_9GAMM|nr:RWP-RK domain-containing protein [Legionella maioricensis]MCL9684783.1 RWP-RK domain-containing protein [Legionella maioricensis]MCL9687815.1 RWP-RK domain-containing protein [Legionella maioricensis]
MTNKNIGHTKESTDKRKSSAAIVGIEKPHERKNKIHLSTSDLARVSMFRQHKAAEVLGVSISTLKRRFYECKLGRWDVGSSYEDAENNAAIEPIKKGQVATKLENIINKASLENVKEVDKITLFALKVAFRQGFENVEESAPKLR